MEEALIRNTIYDQELTLYYPKNSVSVQLLRIPKELTELYQEKPNAVLDLLIRIADGGNPRDSIHAICYGMELVAGASVGAGLALELKYKTHDTVDDDKNLTQRERHVKYLRRKHPEK